ncbi:MAG: substrate-binding domain-containing protein [Eubacteriales bacterium]|nr:substrate-binding domain-containing protein [Eubacteriales bacterium]
MKKIVVVFVVLVSTIALLMTGCATSEPSSETSTASETSEATTDEAVDTSTVDEEEQLTFALIHCDQGTWQIYMRDYTQIACDELGVELLVYCGDGDGAKNITDLQTAIELGVDAVLYTPVDNATGLKMEEMLNEAGIPYIDFDRGSAETAGEGMHISFVGPDSVQAGYDLGIYMIEELGLTKIIEIDGNMSSEPGIDRKEGLNMALEEHPEVELLGAQAADWALDKGMNVAQDLLNAHPEAEGIWCANDDMGLGALAAAETLGLNDIIIGAMDCSDAGLESIIANGAFKVTIGAHFVCGPIAAISMYDYLHGAAVEPTIIFNMLKVDSNNAEDFLAVNSEYGLIKGRTSELSLYLNPDADPDRWVNLLSGF